MQGARACDAHHSRGLLWGQRAGYSPGCFGAGMDRCRPGGGILGLITQPRGGRVGGSHQHRATGRKRACVLIYRDIASRTKNANTCVENKQIPTTQRGANRKHVRVVVCGGRENGNRAKRKTYLERGFSPETGAPGGFMIIGSPKKNSALCRLYLNKTGGKTRKSLDSECYSPRA